MKQDTIPKKIYLQHDPFNEGCEDDPIKLDGATWCHERVGDSDIEYLLDSEVEKKVKEAMALQCKKLIEDFKQMAMDVDYEEAPQIENCISVCEEAIEELKKE